MGKSEPTTRSNARSGSSRRRGRALERLGHRLLVAPRGLLGFLLFLGVFLTTGGAFAAAPMCGEDAVSIEAPPPLYPSDGATLEGCEESATSIEVGVPLPDGPLKLKAHIDLDVAVLGEPVRVGRPSRLRVGVPYEERGLRAGILRREERPPRA